MNMRPIKFFTDVLSSPTKREKAQDMLSTLKMAKAGFSTLCTISLSFAVLSAYDGKFFRAAALLPAAYLGYELKTVAENGEEILKNPEKKIRSIWAYLSSSKKNLEFATEGAPLTRRIGRAYINYYEALKIE